jgi:hypothetical protein
MFNDVILAQHVQCSCTMDMQREDMDMKQRHAAWTCSMDMQQEHAARTCSKDMQHEDMDIEHRLKV